MKSPALLLIILFATTTAIAQPLRFGITASPGISWLKPDNIEFGSDSIQIANEGARFAYQFGLHLDFNIGENERYAFSTGLFIHNPSGLLKRDTQDVTGSVLTGTETLKLQYIQIPATLRLRTNEIGFMTYFGQFGIIPGVKIRSRGESNEKLTNINLFDLALHAAGGLEYSLSGNTSILAALFFSSGFTNVVNDKDGERIIMNTFGLKTGILF